MPDEVVVVENDQQAGEALFQAMQEDGQRPAGTAGPGAAEPTLHAEQVLENQRTASNPEGEQVVPPATPEVTPETDASFTKLDPNALPDELKPWYHSMQADYTRKTQTIAELRKQYESLGDADPNQVNFALEFYNNLQNPDFAKSFHEQLGGTLTNLGYLDQQVEETVQPQPAPAVTPDSYDDPDQFFQQKFGEYEEKLNKLQSTIQAQQEQAEQQTAYAAFAGEIQRQDSIIRDANPHYADADFDAIYKMSEAYGGDLLQAQGAYENAVADRINRMLAAKTSVSQQYKGEVVGSGTAQEPKNFGDNLEAAHRAAQEVLRQHLANE